MRDIRWEESEHNGVCNAVNRRNAPVHYLCDLSGAPLQVVSKTEVLQVRKHGGAEAGGSRGGDFGVAEVLNGVEKAGGHLCRDVEQDGVDRDKGGVVDCIVCQGVDGKLESEGGKEVGDFTQDDAGEGDEGQHLEAESVGNGVRADDVPYLRPGDRGGVDEGGRLGGVVAGCAAATACSAHAKPWGHGGLRGRGGATGRRWRGRRGRRDAGRGERVDVGREAVFCATLEDGTRVGRRGWRGCATWIALNEDSPCAQVVKTVSPLQIHSANGSALCVLPSFYEPVHSPVPPLRISTVRLDA